MNFCMRIKKTRKKIANKRLALIIHVEYYIILLHETARSADTKILN